MNERDTEINASRPPRPPVPGPPVERRDPCAEITAKLEAKRKELEAIPAEIEKLSMEALRVAGVDDVLTPEKFKELRKLCRAVDSVADLFRQLKAHGVPLEDFKSWVKRDMPDTYLEPDEKVCEALKPMRLEPDPMDFISRVP